MIGNKTGKLGEDIAELFFKKRGYLILYRNYWKPYGEIDIVCQKDNKLHFVEVKAVSRPLTPELARQSPDGSSRMADGHSDGGQAREIPSVNNVSRESYRPEENVHGYKLKRLSRVIRSFLQKKEFKDTDWQFDICVVQIDMGSKKAKVKIIENELLPE